MMTNNPVPDQAEIIVIGGGVIGASVSYHLAKYGKRDVLLLEKSELTNGCTWHAAGLVGQLRGTLGLTRLMQYSTRLFGQLEQETGLSPGWNPVGSLRLAASHDRWTEIRQMAIKARAFDIDLHLLDGDQAASLFPLIDKRSIHGAALLPNDGYVDPYGLTQSLAKGFRVLGGKIHENVAVTGFVRAGRRIQAVETDNQSIKCDLVINCGGLWARQIGMLAGCLIPAGIVQHQYMITEKSDEIPDGMPTLRDPDRNFYLKPEAGAFEFGGWEDDSTSIDSERFPHDFTRSLYDSNFDRFAQIFDLTAKRLPILNRLGVKTLINGPIPVSADGEPVMGLIAGTDNLYTACGFTAGIAASGGAGRAMAEWIIDGRPSLDLWSFDIRRFGRFHAESPYLEQRALQSYGRYYKVHWPHEETQAGRKIRCSPLYDELKNAGAVYGAKFGWERVNWFASAAEDAKDIPSFDKPNWFEAVGRECHSIRNHVALVDQSSFFKFEITGRDAVACLNHLSTCQVDRSVGSVIYSQMCNEKGGIESDVVLVRVAEQKFWLITGSGFGEHDRDWIERNISVGQEMNIRDVTEQYAVINLCGPSSRDVLEKVTTSDVSRSAFPYLTSQDINVDGCAVRAARLSYTGELGWEIYIENDQALQVYRALLEAGKEFNVTNAGYRALDSLRMENGYLYWSGEISPYINPYEARLSFRVNHDKGYFIGKQALEEIREHGVKRRLHSFSFDGFVPLYGGEPILCRDKTISSTLSGGYGHTVGKSICYAFLPIEFEQAEQFELETIKGTTPISLHQNPLNSLAGTRVRS